MTQQKTSTKRQSIVIAILAVLLVGLLAFNITYAFFTDKKNTVDQFTFGTISLKAIEGSQENPIISIASESRSKENIMPGDKITGSFNIDLEDGSEDAFIRFKIEADPEFSYLYKDGASTVISDTYEGYIIAFVNGQAVPANIGAGRNSVTIFDAQGNEVTSSITAEQITGFKTFTSYTVTENNQTVTYSVVYSKDTTEESSDPAVYHPVVATVTRTVAGEAGVALSEAESLAKIEQMAKDYQRKVAIDSAIAAINNAMQQSGDLTGLEGFTQVGDGYVYKNTRLAEADEAITAAIAYQIPQSLGNELQGVKVNFKVVVEAVQAANVNTVDFENDGDETAFEELNLDSAADYYNAVKMFYIASATHGEILENLD